MWARLVGVVAWYLYWGRGGAALSGVWGVTRCCHHNIRFYWTDQTTGHTVTSLPTPQATVHSPATGLYQTLQMYFNNKQCGDRIGLIGLVLSRVGRYSKYSVVPSSQYSILAGDNSQCQSSLQAERQQQQIIIILTATHVKTKANSEILLSYF